MLSSDYSSQEPRLTAFISNDPKMIKAFQEGKDIYSSIASLAFNVPYEACCEFHPETHEYQAEGKARRGEAKTIVLGICYGRSVPSIGDQLFGKDKTLTDEEKTAKAQKIYDAVLNAFPNLRQLMINSQAHARKYGYVETILGRRRHIPDMQLPEFEFVPMKGYVNPDVDPLDITTLDTLDQIPKRITDALTKEFSGYKYFGQIVKRTKELAEDKIKVINNRQRIADASRQCVNSQVQGSAADQTKLAMLLVANNPRWRELDAHIILPVHDELIAEVPEDNYEEAANLLSNLMCKAADFLPFDSKCDVTITHRWYGLEYPCPYPQPQSLNNLSEEEIKWLQYHLIECEYELPVIQQGPDKPRGDAAKGVNGVFTEELKAAIADYKLLYKVYDDHEFINHIHNKVTEGE